MHLFCVCEIVILFWNNVSQWISSKLRINIAFDKQHMLFGFENKSRFFNMVNELWLCAIYFL